MREASASTQVDTMQKNVHDLGFPWIVLPLHLRTALRQYHLWWGRALIHNISRGMMAYGIAVVIAAKYTGERFNSLTFAAVFLYLPIYGIMFTIGAPRRMRRYRLVGLCAAAINSCATAKAKTGEDRSDALREASVAIRSVERAVFRTRRAQRTVAIGRPSRQTALRTHAGKVVAVLRSAENRLDDTHQDCALEQLTGLLVRIAASSAANRIGDLLPVSITDQEEPARSYDLLRHAAAVLMLTGAAVGVGIWNVPDVTAWAVIAGVGILSAIVAFGADWRRVLSLIEVFRP
ncbi:hypothetical protein [Streptomyces sp. NPDC053560]|uniref:hypothetical protein n=1 Tax=Streptomyces sp. NPDC053560 TaxID=3365711 RepID=UPI0037D7426F